MVRGMEVLFSSFRFIFLLRTPCDTHLFFVVYMLRNPHMQTPAPNQNASSKSPFYLARHLWYAALWSCLSATPSLQTMLSQSRMRTASFTFKRFKIFTCIFCPLTLIVLSIKDRPKFQVFLKFYHLNVSWSDPRC